MQNVVRPQRGRSMSMQEYDIPLRQRMNSAQLSYSPPVSCSPPSADGHHSGSGGGSSPGSSSPTIPDKGFAQQPLMQSNWVVRDSVWAGCDSLIMATDFESCRAVRNWEQLWNAYRNVAKD